MSATLLRRSVGLPAIPAVLAVIVANVMLRGRPWVHEWFWAYFNYHFVMIFLGPLAAGLGAWEGARLARSAELLGATGGTRRALGAAAAGVFAWAAVPYLVGIVWISALVKGAGTPGWPGIVELSTLVPAFTFLAMWAIVGAAAGYRSGSPLGAPLATVASFSLILVCYIVNYTLVRVGGATGSVLGLAPRPEIQAGQVALYASAGAWALLRFTRANASRQSATGRVPALVTGGLALGLAVLLFADRGADFRDRPVPMRCGGQPPVCLAVGYDQKLEFVQRSLVPYLGALRDIDAPLPVRFVQSWSAKEDLVGNIPDRLALGDASWTRSAVLSAYSKSACDTMGKRELAEKWDGVDAWLAAVGGDRSWLATAPEVLKTGSPDEQAAWIRDAIDRLRRCA